MPESFVLSEEKKMPAVCDCDEASLMTPNSPGVPSCEKCWMQVSPVPASDEVCSPVMRCFQLINDLGNICILSGKRTAEVGEPVNKCRPLINPVVNKSVENATSCDFEKKNCDPSEMEKRFQPVRREGVVTSFIVVNPHLSISVMVSPAGQGHVRRHRLSLHFYDPPAVE
ncbi:hypothetical protein TNCV_2452821 [Trichonephila clavipes]|nr:hypothetical protein TNCV_2452821 [Trichonephila clavipes]